MYLVQNVVALDGIQKRLTPKKILLHIRSMKSYLDTIIEHAASRNVELKEAFRVADIPTSTYYRTINNATELRYETALKIFKAVDEKIKRDKYLERKGYPTVTRKRVYRY